MSNAASSTTDALTVLYNLSPPGYVMPAGHEPRLIELIFTYDIDYFPSSEEAE